MKTRLSLIASSALSTLTLAAPVVHAQDVAQVVSSIPVIQQVSVPRQVCSTQQVLVDPPKSGAGAAMGAIAGGAVGNQIGDGSGRAVATLLGVIGGAMLGDRIEGQPAARTQERTTCTTQNIYESRTIGYNVTYEYAGRRYQVQLPQDPGPTLQIQVTPVMPGMPAGGRTSALPGDGVIVSEALPAPAAVVVRDGMVREAYPSPGWVAPAPAPAVTWGVYGGGPVYRYRHHHWR